MNLLWLLILVLLDPLVVLDLRIAVQQKKLAQANLSVADRRVLKRDIRSDMYSRYKLLEQIEDV